MSEDSQHTQYTPDDLENFLPYACHQLQAPFSVVVSTRILEKYVKQGDIEKRTKAEKSLANVEMQAQVPSITTENEVNSLNLISCAKENIVFMTVVLDTQGQVIELELINTIVPTYFLKIFELCVPFHLNLNKISLRSCPVSEKTIHELSSILSMSKITELCLDKSPLPHCNCAALLQHQTYLTSLSINRCGLVDEDCEEIAVWLQYGRPTCHLQLLSLAFNFIKDRGAVALASMLRSNRHLRYLNLADNQVTDTGARAIFDSLMQFPLTTDEIYSKRVQNIEYLRLYRKVYAKFYQEAIALYKDKVFEDRSGGRKNIAGKRSNVTLAVNQAPNMGVDIVLAATIATVDTIGPNDNPFSASDTLYQDGQLHCVGNTSLAYINISHNNLSVRSVSKLIEVLRYQEHLRAGLVRVTVEGNSLPTSSPDLLQLAKLQRRAVTRIAKTRLSKIDRNNT